MPRLEREKLLLLLPFHVLLGAFELLQGPFHQPGWEFDFIGDLRELLLQIVMGDAACLHTGSAFFVAAATIEAVLLFLVCCTQRFTFEFHDDHPITCAAVDHTSIGIVIHLRTGFALPPDDLLGPIELNFGNHGFVFSRIQFPFIWAQSTKEWVLEDAVQARQTEGSVLDSFLAFPPAARLRQTPLLRGNVVDLRHRVFLREQEFPAPLYEIEALLVFEDDTLASQSARIGFVAEGRRPRLPAHLHFIEHAACNVAAQIAGVLRRHAHFHCQHEHVIAREVRPLVRHDGFDLSPLQEPLDARTIDEVASESIELPGIEHIDEIVLRINKQTLKVITNIGYFRGLRF